jgi:uroporphyrinogen III methyltransferase/synthase
MKEKKQSGKVYLVGAGPGDPGLLTIKAYKVLKVCDVVIYDALMNPAILAWVSPEAEKIFIGPSRHAGRLDQKKVEQLMVRKAAQGKFVVRLKGGDPFIFGRGGEEAEVLTAAGITWEVIPGISSGQAAPAYAAIPLTHRDCASSVTFITGHESKDKSIIKWDQLRYSFNTLVIFMGAARIKDIVEQLQKSDYKPNTPVAVIESGTYPEQRVRTGTLNNIIKKITDDPIKTPALIVVGEVVKYRKKLIKYLSQSNINGDYLGEEIMDIIT